MRDEPTATIEDRVRRRILSLMIAAGAAGLGCELPLQPVSEATMKTKRQVNLVMTALLLPAQGGGHKSRDCYRQKKPSSSLTNPHRWPNSAQFFVLKTPSSHHCAT